jgi:hemerythrin-like metal-binding protein
MALIEWRPEFSVGIESVDYEHRSLFRLLNNLHKGLEGGADREGILDFLGEVYARIASHFALEEAIMLEKKYDQLADHKADHERLLDEIREIMDDYAVGAYENYDEVLAEHLHDWFSVHFKTKDARLHRLLG